MCLGMISLRLFCLGFTELLDSLILYFPRFGHFQPLFFSDIFPVHTLTPLCSFFPSLLFKSDNFYWSVFKFTDSFLCHLILLLNSSSGFLILVILFFISKIPIWFFFISFIPLPRPFYLSSCLPLFLKHGLKSWFKVCLIMHTFLSFWVFFCWLSFASWDFPGCLYTK